jgi:hypothetical protein
LFVIAVAVAVVIVIVAVPSIFFSFLARALEMDTVDGVSGFATEFLIRYHYYHHLSFCHYFELSSRARAKSSFWWEKCHRRSATLLLKTPLRARKLCVLAIVRFQKTQIIIFWGNTRNNIEKPSACIFRRPK